MAREQSLYVDEISSIQIRRRNIDARQRKVLVNLSLDVYLDGRCPQRMTSQISSTQTSLVHPRSSS